MSFKGEMMEVVEMACRFRSVGKLYGARYEGLVVEVVERERAQITRGPTWGALLIQHDAAFERKFHFLLFTMGEIFQGYSDGFVSCGHGWPIGYVSTKCAGGTAQMSYSGGHVGTGIVREDLKHALARMWRSNRSVAICDRFDERRNRLGKRWSYE